MNTSAIRNDFCEQILADQEAMSRMQDEGGASQSQEPSAAQDWDSSPLIALFRDASSAEAALRELRASGILNENIGVGASDGVILSPANDPSTYRAAGEACDGSEFEEAVLPDSFRPPSVRATPATPNSAGYNADFEADQYHRPQHHVMVSVQVEGDQRQPIRDLLIRAGAAS
jgi:hypothetical protein